MRGNWYFRAGALVVSSLLLAAAGCSANGGGTAGPSQSGAALSSVVNVSKSSGGTLRYVMSGGWDSLDLGNTYDAFSWDFGRYYGRSLMAYAPAAGAAGKQLVPDLATAPGISSDGGRTWTYHIRPGVKFSNGQLVTSEDVKYAIERSNWGRSVLSIGPTYFLNLIDPQAAQQGQSWPGPYKSPGTSLPASMNDTPNPSTIVFHLLKPFAEFDYIASLPDTAPVPPSADTGAHGGVNYQYHIVSSGPYQIDSYNQSTGLEMSKNPYWDPSTDPLHLHPQLVDKITVRVNVQPDTADQMLLNGQADMELGTSLQVAAQDKVLTTASLKQYTDNPIDGFLDYAAIDQQVPPFNNLDCREAVEYAANKVELQNQYGGTVDGQIASTVMTPTVAGYQSYPDLYPTPNNQGDPTKAREHLAACRSALGAQFTNTVNIAARSDVPPEAAAAEALSAQLNAVGFNTRVLEFPFATYSSEYVGVPQYDAEHQIGLVFYGWGADFPDGYGFLQGMLNSSSISSAGNPNLSMIKDSQIDGLLNQAVQDLDSARRTAVWSNVDQLAMRQAAILPVLYDKQLLYRPPQVTNVMFSEAYGMYDYPYLGLK